MGACRGPTGGRLAACRDGQDPATRAVMRTATTYSQVGELLLGRLRGLSRRRGRELTSRSNRTLRRRRGRAKGADDAPA